jgi:hypothetical protein
VPLRLVARQVGDPWVLVPDGLVGPPRDREDVELDVVQAQHVLPEALERVQREGGALRSRGMEDDAPGRRHRKP